MEMGSRVRGHMVASLLKLYLGGGSEVRLHLGKQPVKLAIGRAVGLRGGVGDGDRVVGVIHDCGTGNRTRITLR